MPRQTKLDRMRPTESFSVVLTITIPGRKRDFVRVFESFKTRASANAFKVTAEKNIARRQNLWGWDNDGIDPEWKYEWRVASVWAEASPEALQEELEKFNNLWKEEAVTE